MKIGGNLRRVLSVRQRRFKPLIYVFRISTYRVRLPTASHFFLIFNQFSPMRSVKIAGVLGRETLAVSVD